MTTSRQIKKVTPIENPHKIPFSVTTSIAEVDKGGSRLEIIRIKGEEEVSEEVMELIQVANKWGDKMPPYVVLYLSVN